MPLPSSLTSIEANALLEEIGLREDYRSGQSTVFVDPADDTKVVVIQEGWDIPTGDLVRNLERNGIDPASLADAYEKLYRPG